MIKLEEYSRNELKKMAAARGAVDYHNLNKAALIKLINGLAFKQENKEVIKEVKQTLQRGTNLTHKALQWQTYLKRVNISPEAFLYRFPEHAEKQYIEELLPVVIPTPEPNENDGETAD